MYKVKKYSRSDYLLDVFNTESVDNRDFEDEEDVNPSDAAFMRGYLEEDEEKEQKNFPDFGTIDFEEVPPLEL